MKLHKHGKPVKFRQVRIKSKLIGGSEDHAEVVAAAKLLINQAVEQLAERGSPMARAVPSRGRGRGNHGGRGGHGRSAGAAHDRSGGRASAKPKPIAVQGSRSAKKGRNGRKGAKGPSQAQRSIDRMKREFLQAGETFVEHQPATSSASNGRSLLTEVHLEVTDALRTHRHNRGESMAGREKLTGMMASPASPVFSPMRDAVTHSVRPEMAPLKLGQAQTQLFSCVAE